MMYIVLLLLFRGATLIELFRPVHGGNTAFVAAKQQSRAMAHRLATAADDYFQKCVEEWNALEKELQEVKGMNKDMVRQNGEKSPNAGFEPNQSYFARLLCYFMSRTWQQI